MQGREGSVWLTLFLFTLPCLPFSSVGPVAVGLPPIWLHAVATSGFLPEAGEPRISPALPGFSSSLQLGILPLPVTHCPSLLWVPEQLLFLQPDIWGFHRPWLLGPTLPELVRARDWTAEGLGDTEGKEGSVSQPCLLPANFSLTFLL